jgi:glycosyltransferase involved in cell wall biosynthesis
MTSKPWIASMEYSSSFYSWNDSWYKDEARRRRLTNHFCTRNCRKILAYSQASLNSLRLALGDSFDTVASKTDIVYPALPTKYLVNDIEGKSSEPMRILFVGNHFFDKGGRELFNAYRALRARLRVELIIVTSVPQHHISLFESLVSKIRSEPGVELYFGGVHKDVLWKDIFPRAHVFCMPSYMETFGYLFLEAMANHLPIVATDAFAIPEIVSDGRTGILIPAPIASFERNRLRSPESLRLYRESILNEGVFKDFVTSLTDALTLLFTDDSLRRRMGEAAFSEVSRGRFSVEQRNRELRRHYEEALE